MNYLVEFQVEKNEKQIYGNIVLSLMNFAINQKQMFGIYFDWFVKQGAVDFFCGTNISNVLNILNNGSIKDFNEFNAIDDILATIIDIETRKIVEHIDIVLICDSPSNAEFCEIVSELGVDNITYLNVEKIIEVY